MGQRHQPGLRSGGRDRRADQEAGKLAGGPAAPVGVRAAVQFGGGAGAVAPPPVGPRGAGQLVLFALLALASLVLIAAAGARVAILRRGVR